MLIEQRVIVFDADDIAAESAFWAALLGGTVDGGEDWHDVMVDGECVVAVQRAPNHVSPEWPVGVQQQQMHLDLYVDDLLAAHEVALSLGARQVQGLTAPADNPDGDEVFAVYLDPAGHPFCLGVH